MRRYENECVGCPPEMGCIGIACPYRNVMVNYCDICGEEARYKIYDEDYCEDCAEKFLQEEFGQLTISEKAGLLGIEFFDVDDE